MSNLDRNIIIFFSFLFGIILFILTMLVNGGGHGPSEYFFYSFPFFVILYNTVPPLAWILALFQYPLAVWLLMKASKSIKWLWPFLTFVLLYLFAVWYIKMEYPDL